MMRLRRPSVHQAAFVALLAAFSLYAAIFVAKTSFVLHGTRVFTLFDDAMISMRYARNLVDGFGLVYNPGGPRVEGYSNPLWVLVMAAAHLLPMSEGTRCVSVQILGWAALTANLVMMRAIVRMLSPHSEMAVWAALVPAAFYLPLNNWALQGTETGALAAIATGSVLVTLRSLEKGKPSPLPFVLPGVAMLLRPDMVVLLAVVGGYLWFADPLNRRRTAITGAATLLLFAGGPLLFRLAYYGQLAPNTYHLKLEGFPVTDRIARGAIIFGRFVWQFHPVLFAIPIARAIIRPNRERALPMLLFVALCLYSIYIGGDAWEGWGGANRFLCVGMPAFFVLFGIGVADGAARIGAWIGARHSGALRALGTLVVLFTVAATLQMNRIPGSPSLRAFFLAEKPLEAWGNAWATEIGRICASITTEEAELAVVWAGNIPYHAHRTSIDLLGRCDARIARERAHARPEVPRLEAFYPGHMKWDYGYSIGELMPDLIVQLWDLRNPAAHTMLLEIPDAARPYIRDRYVLLDIGGYRILARRNSPHVLWKTVERYIRSYQP